MQVRALRPGRKSVEAVLGRYPRDVSSLNYDVDKTTSEDTSAGDTYVSLYRVLYHTFYIRGGARRTDDDLRGVYMRIINVMRSITSQTVISVKGQLPWMLGGGGGEGEEIRARVDRGEGNLRIVAVLSCK